MTRCAAVNYGSSGFAPDCGRGSGSSSNALNGMATRRTKKMTADLGLNTCPHPRPRRTWVSIAIAVVAVAAVLGGELWALDAAPATKSEVVTELNGTLARVVAASLLITPAD
jgi:hypothetical protein